MLLNVVQSIAPDNYVAFTFFIGYIAMLAASVFFFVERNSVSDKWKMSDTLFLSTKKKTDAASIAM